jgi:hypothetical protein
MTPARAGVYPDAAEYATCPLVTTWSTPTALRIQRMEPPGKSVEGPISSSAGVVPRSVAISARVGHSLPGWPGEVRVEVGGVAEAEGDRGGGRGEHLGLAVAGPGGRVAPAREVEPPESRRTHQQARPVCVADHGALGQRRPVGGAQFAVGGALKAATGPVTFEVETGVERRSAQGSGACSAALTASG